MRYTHGILSSSNYRAIIIPRADTLGYIPIPAASTSTIPWYVGTRRDRVANAGLNRYTSTIGCRIFALCIMGFA